MDFGIIDVVHPLDPSTGVPPYEFYEPARLAMGDTRRYAERVGLIDMTPRGDLASTGYALANPGSEYVVLQPQSNHEALTVTLTTGTYDVEWFSVSRRETIAAASAQARETGAVQFTPPVGDGPWVLYLRRSDR
jgi:hypothetical protein